MSSWPQCLKQFGTRFEGFSRWRKADARLGRGRNQGVFQVGPWHPRRSEEQFENSAARPSEDLPRSRRSLKNRESTGNRRTQEQCENSVARQRGRPAQKQRENSGRADAAASLNKTAREQPARSHVKEQRQKNGAGSGGPLGSGRESGGRRIRESRRSGCRIDLKNRPKRESVPRLKNDAKTTWGGRSGSVQASA